ncbi:MAG: 30S ribosome-binding factor RbfA [Deltaproteobacteria bacterium]|nr:30S ribosome-binding factor RbfA [Deltaproteobacteria bacterium]
MPFKRADRVADLIQIELSDILLRQIQDPRLKMLTITDVKLTDDLRSAKIFFIEMGKDECDPQCMLGLEKATGFLKRELGKRLQLRYVPDIRFIVDNSFAHGSRIEKLIAEIHQSEETNDK